MVTRKIYQPLADVESRAERITQNICGEPYGLALYCIIVSMLQYCGDKKGLSAASRCGVQG